MTITHEPDMLSEEQIVVIFVEVANGRGEHGGFLKSFAEAVMHADPANLHELAPVALRLIRKYELQDYARLIGKPNNVTRVETADAR